MKPLKVKKSYTTQDEASIKIYFNEINKYPILSREEENHYFKVYQETEDVRVKEKIKEKIVQANLRFVITVAKQFQNQGLTFEDLISEGNIGLVKSVDKFELDKGFKFISYAVWWIRQNIMESIAMNGRMMRLPINKHNSILRFNKIYKTLEQSLERVPTLAEINEIEGEFDNDIFEFYSVSHISLDATFNTGDDDNSNTLLDTLPNEEDYHKKDSEELREQLLNIIAKLDKREQKVIMYCFGMVDGRKYSLEEVGDTLSLTRERVRQIRDKAVRKIRSNPSVKGLVIYLN